MKLRASALLVLLGCGAPPPPPTAPAPPPAAPLPEIAAPPAIAAAGSARETPCRWRMLGSPSGGSGVLGPALERVFADVPPVLADALCSCAASDWPARVGLVTRLHTERGVASLELVDLLPRDRAGRPVGEPDRALVAAREAEALGCMAPIVAALRYAPYEVGSDCIGCGEGGLQLGSWPAFASRDDGEPPGPVERESVMTIGLAFVLASP